MAVLSPAWTMPAAATGETGRGVALQFTSGRHVVSFDRRGAHIAAGDHMLRVEFVGGAGGLPVSEQIVLPDAAAAPLMGRVSYSALWPGVDLWYEPVSGGILQSSYLLEPGADVDRIRLHYNAPVSIAADGGLQIGYESGEMRESPPVAWQDIDGQRLPIEVAFRLVDSAADDAQDRDRLVGFALGKHDPAHPVMIDPILQWNTFMGAASSDSARAVTVDAAGNVYVAGYGFDTWGSPVSAWNGAVDAFVAKLNSSGVLQWNTFMGSSSNDEGYGIALDGSGNVYVVGASVASWGNPIAAFAGSSDAFAAKLNNDGVRLWNTFMGAPLIVVPTTGFDEGYAIAVDASSSVYVVGASDSTWGAPLNAHAGSVDAFVVELDSNGVRQWHTFLGSSGEDWGRGVAAAGAGQVFVAGESDAAWGTPVAPHSGDFDAFAAKLDGSGALQWSTFMGSANVDWGRGIAVDASGNVYLTGLSLSSWGSPVNAHSLDGADAFAAKLNGSGALQWHTFMGGESTNAGRGIALDGSGNVYVTGESFATWGTPVLPFEGISDAFAAKLDGSGVLQWNAFMGSTTNDYGRGIAVDPAGPVYVVGDSDASWGTPLRGHSGGLDAFAAGLLVLDAAVPAFNVWGLAALLAGLLGSARWIQRSRGRRIA